MPTSHKLRYIRTDLSEYKLLTRYPTSLLNSIKNLKNNKRKKNCFHFNLYSEVLNEVIPEVMHIFSDHHIPNFDESPCCVICQNSITVPKAPLRQVTESGMHPKSIKRASNEQRSDAMHDSCKNDVTDEQTHHKTGRTFTKTAGTSYSMNMLTVDKPTKNCIMTLVNMFFL